MKLFHPIGRILALVLLSLLFSAAAHAQATRTWVSGVGDDVNPCSRTAPCKTFAGAISKTAASGVISVLDPGGFGAVTITKSITIENDGAIGGILNSLTNGVIINAAQTDKVVLRGLSIDGGGNGLDGIRFLKGGSLTVERCVINGQAQKGINFIPNGEGGAVTPSLVVTDTQIHNAADPTNGGAINVAATNGATARVMLDNVQMTRSQFGLKVTAPARVTVHNSIASNNDLNGFQASGAGASMVIDDSVAANNNGTAVASLSGAVVTLSRTMIANNAGGLSAFGGGVINTFGDNRNIGNTTPGAPTAPVTPTQ